MPPRPDPTVAQLMQMMMEDREAARMERQANLQALQQLTQLATNNLGNNNGNGHHDDPRHKLKNFQNTNPPIFCKLEQPLDADDWLRQMENNLAVARVDEVDKVLFTTHYLSGAARAWWDSARAMQGGQ